MKRNARGTALHLQLLCREVVFIFIIPVKKNQLVQFYTNHELQLPVFSQKSAHKQLHIDLCGYISPLNDSDLKSVSTPLLHNEVQEQDKLYTDSLDILCLMSASVTSERDTADVCCRTFCFAHANVKDILEFLSVL